MKCWAMIVILPGQKRAKLIKMGFASVIGQIDRLPEGAAVDQDDLRNHV
jgi:hypothetical protein